MADRINVLDILHQKAEAQRQRLEAWQNLQDFAVEQNAPPKEKGFLSGWKDVFTSNPLDTFKDTFASALNSRLGQEFSGLLSRFDTAGNAWAESVTDLTTDGFGEIPGNLRNVLQSGATLGLTYGASGMLAGKAADPLVEQARIQELNEQFQARPFWQELGLGIVTDPTNLVPARGAANVGRMTAANLGRRSMPAMPRNLATLLPEFEQSLAEVATRGSGDGLDRFTQEAVTRLGINRLPDVNNPAEVALVAYQRQKLIGEEAVNLALQAAFDAHARPLTGQTGQIWKLDENGFINDSVVHWIDALENPALYDDVLAPGQTAAFNDYRQFFGDMEQLGRLYEVPVKWRDVKPGRAYISIIVKAIEDYQLRKSTNPALQRLAESATELVNRGVKLENDPREVARLHAQWIYDLVADQQLSQHMSRYSIPPSDLVPQALKDSHFQADEAIRQTEGMLRRFRQEIAQTSKQEQVARARAKGYDDQRRFLEDSIARYDALLAEGRAEATLRDEPLYQAWQQKRLEVTQLEQLRHTMQTSFGRNRVNLAQLKTELKDRTSYISFLERETDRLKGIATTLNIKAPQGVERRLFAGQRQLNDVLVLRAGLEDGKETLARLIQETRWNLRLHRGRPAEAARYRDYLRKLTRWQRETRAAAAKNREGFKNEAAFVKFLQRELNRLEGLLGGVGEKLPQRAEGELARQQGRFDQVTALEQDFLRRQSVLDDWLAKNQASLEQARQEARLAENAVNKRRLELGELRATSREERRLNPRANTATRRRNELRRLETAYRARRAELEAWQKGLKAQLPALKEKRRIADAALTRARERIRATELASLAQFPKSVQALFGPNAPEHIPIGIWRGNYFSQEMADALNQGLARLQQQPNIVAREVEKAANLSRMLSATFDLAMPFVQGLPMFFANPQGWQRMAADSYAAILDPTLQARLLRENYAGYQRLVQMGVPVGDTEFFRAALPGKGYSLEPLERRLQGEAGNKLRRFRQGWKSAWKQTVGRFGASYSVGLASARRELVEGIGKSWQGSEAELGQYVRNMTGGLDSRALGIRPDQRALESMWLAFSPRLLRSTTALVSDALQGILRNATLEGATAAQAQALDSLTRFASGVTMLYVHTGLALNREPEEIFEGLNPLNGKKFLSYNFNGDWIGVGGQLRALLQVAGGIVSAAAPGGKPIEDFLAVNQQDNPLIGFWINRGAPAINIAGGVIEATTGADALPYDQIDGKADLSKHLFTNLLPFVAQGMLEGEQLTTSAAGFLGARTSPQTFSEMRQEVIDEMAGQLGVAPGTQYRDIPSGKRDILNADPRVAAGLKKLPQQKDIKSELVRNAVSQWQEIKTDLEADLRQHIDAGMTGSRLRERIIDMKQNRYAASQALFSGAVEEAMESGDAGPLADQLAELYWSAPLPEDYATGRLDFSAQRAEREAVLAEAARLGIDPEYIRGEGPGTYRGQRFDDPVAREAVEELERAQELLREYWEVPQKILKGAALQRFEEYESLPANMQGLYAQRFPFIRELEERVAQRRDQMRMRNPELDQALVQWYDRAPIRQRLLRL